MAKMVTLTIDDQQVTVPQGTLIVDAAKKIGNDIPVFCYHPKMEPVGMCRMCLVEVGRPVIDRSTGQPTLDENGKPVIQFSPKLETGCTTPVSEGMLVRTKTNAVTAARKDVLEFLLTSHPLDCPICDKGGECPLQNLTMAHAAGESRFLVDDKIHLAKHVPLGDLIYLDRERCIQCSRCVRFQEIIADDPVIGFYNRGRKLEIVTFSEPGFDSIFSGNTSDICPVGALTTADFRFGARPWELKQAASVCTQCPVGCNLTFNVRREAKAGGGWVIKRVMPRQNEAVNEIWICDKGRFAYHYTESDQRLTQPLLRRNGELTPVSWDEALQAAAAQIKDAGSLVTLAGGRLSNEDLFNLAEVTRARGGKAVLYSNMAGGDLTARYGLTEGSDLGTLGAGSAIVVAACDLHQEAPVWWLRIKAAAQRGAALIVLNPRDTRLDKFAKFSLRYAYGQEASALTALLPGGASPNADYSAAAEALASAENVLVLYGSEGLGLAGSAAVAQAAADLTARYAKPGKPNNGLLAVWDKANAQGGWDLGLRPSLTLAADLQAAGVLWVAGADPAGDDPALAAAVDAAGFVLVQELTLTETARRADLVLPALPFTEREGTLTSGERRVQRFYPAIPARPEARADFAIAAQLAQHLGLTLEGRAASLVLARIAAAVPAYAGISYQRLAETSEQWPIIGRADVYYGGTSYNNGQGLGLTLPRSLNGTAPESNAYSLPTAPEDGLLLVPVTVLYDRGSTVLPSQVLHPRLAQPALVMHPDTAARLGLAAGESARVLAGGWQAEAGVRLDETLPQGIALVPRSTGLPISAPLAVKLQRLVGAPMA